MKDTNGNVIPFKARIKPARGFVRQDTKDILSQLSAVTESDVINARIDGESLSNDDKASILALVKVAGTDYEKELSFQEFAFDGVGMEDVVVTSDPQQRTLAAIFDKMEKTAPHVAVIRKQFEHVLNGVLREQAAARNAFVGVSIPQGLLKTMLAAGLVSKPTGGSKPSVARTTATEVSDF